jgi:hypothetical protein
LGYHSGSERGGPEQPAVWRAQRCIDGARLRTAEIIAGSDTGGDQAAAIYTIVQTAKLNGVNPEAISRIR